MPMEDRNKDPVLHGCVPLYRETPPNRSEILFPALDNSSLFSL